MINGAEVILLRVHAFFIGVLWKRDGDREWKQRLEFGGVKKQFKRLNKFWIFLKSSGLKNRIWTNEKICSKLIESQKKIVDLIYLGGLTVLSKVIEFEKTVKKYKFKNFWTFKTLFNPLAPQS